MDRRTVEMDEMQAVRQRISRRSRADVTLSNIWEEISHAACSRKGIYSRHCNSKTAYPGRTEDLCHPVYKRRCFCCGDSMWRHGEGNRCEILGRRKRIYAPLQSDQEKNRESPEISRRGKTARRKQEILDASEASVGALCPWDQFTDHRLLPGKAGFADRPSKIQKRIHRLCDDRIRKLEHYASKLRDQEQSAL